MAPDRKSKQRIALTRRRVMLAAPAVLLPALSGVNRLALVKPAFAALDTTPSGPEGPFYPARIPWDDDADLLQVIGEKREAPGEVLYLEGRVLDGNGRPLPAAQIEIWQCDLQGIYRHPSDPRYKQRDNRFQGFGTAQADALGRFAFRTIVPVPYAGRTPHIHVRVLIKGRLLLTTQLYRRDYAQNNTDFLFNRLAPDAQELVQMDLKEIEGTERPSFEAAIDIVVLDPQ